MFLFAIVSTIYAMTRVFLTVVLCAKFESATEFDHCGWITCTQCTHMPLALHALPLARLHCTQTHACRHIFLIASREIAVMHAWILGRQR